MSASGIRLGQVDTELPTPAALADAAANPTAPMVGAAGLVFNGTTWNRARAASAVADADGGTSMGPAGGYVWNGATWDRRRTPNVFRNVFATTNVSTAVWTPAAGKKFRLLGFRMAFRGDTSQGALGAMTANLADAAAVIPFLLSVYLSVAAPNVNGQLADTGWIDLGNGYLSAAANNVLNVQLSATLTAGVVQVAIAGTEE